MLAIVESPAGELLVGTDPTGISRFSRQGVLLETYRSKSGLRMERVDGLAVDGQQRLWAVGYGGVFRSRAPLGTSDLKFERMDVSGIGHGDYIHNAGVDEAGTVWITTSRGLAHFDGNSWRVYTQADGLKSSDLGAIVLRRMKSGLAIETHWALAVFGLKATRFKQPTLLSKMDSPPILYWL